MYKVTINLKTKKTSVTGCEPVTGCVASLLTLLSSVLTLDSEETVTVLSVTLIHVLLAIFSFDRLTDFKIVTFLSIFVNLLQGCAKSCKHSHNRH